MIRYLLVYLWLIAVYVVTAITATNNILPVPPELLEARNIIVHATTYAITGVLLAWAGDRPGRFDAGALLVLLITALLLGVGQGAAIATARAYPPAAKPVRPVCRYERRGCGPAALYPGSANASGVGDDRRRRLGLL